VLTVNPLFSKVSCVKSELRNADQDNSQQLLDITHEQSTSLVADASHTTHGPTSSKCAGSVCNVCSLTWSDPLRPVNSVPVL